MANSDGVNYPAFYLVVLHCDFPASSGNAKHPLSNTLARDLGILSPYTLFLTFQASFRGIAPYFALPFSPANATLRQVGGASGSKTLASDSPSATQSIKRRWTQPTGCLPVPELLLTVPIVVAVGVSPVSTLTATAVFKLEELITQLHEPSRTRPPVHHLLSHHRLGPFVPRVLALQAHQSTSANSITINLLAYCDTRLNETPNSVCWGGSLGWSKIDRGPLRTSTSRGGAYVRVKAVLNQMVNSLVGRLRLVSSAVNSLLKESPSPCKPIVHQLRTEDGCVSRVFSATCSRTYIQDRPWLDDGSVIIPASEDHVLLASEEHLVTAFGCVGILDAWALSLASSPGEYNATKELLPKAALVGLCLPLVRLIGHAALRILQKRSSEVVEREPEETLQGKVLVDSRVLRWGCTR
ncbi:hypothetical protein BKA70DRAFT_1502488 [Coprinopsis sp. MPI-PUGE-AT-0042]|nr:hypothetical protein BKA70DRAFT_1502488 [Coprinopsis sp. MPI-PUGE-AT-0042]